MDITPNLPAKIDTSSGPAAEVLQSNRGRPSWKRLALAVAVAAASDALAFFVELILPLQWALDLGTAFLLFLILGRRWAILPALVAEAIPGLGLFPAWILVVGSIILYDDVKGMRKKP
jgi:hypothetical protein